MCSPIPACILLSFAFGMLKWGDSTPQDANVKLFEYPVFSTTEPGVQCGPYAFLAASNALNVPIPISEVLSGKSFQKTNGLSADDIAALARRFGLQASTYSNLSPMALTSARGPLISLIDNSGGNQEGDHWVTFLGMHGERVVTYDSIGGLTETPFREFTFRWSGTAVELFTERTWLISDVGCAQLALTFLLYSPAVGLCSLVIGLRLRNNTKAVVLASFLTIWIVLDGILSPGNLILSQEAREAVECHGERFNEAEVTSIDMISDVHESSIIIDARFPLAFASGHIPNAINLPISSSNFQIREQLPHASRNELIVVYCQNENCSWAAQLSRRLNCLGYRSTVLSGGIEAWVGSGNKLERFLGLKRKQLEPLD